MGVITQEMKDFVNKQRMGFVATVGPDNSPNLSPKGTTVVFDDDHLVFTGIRSDHTLSNLEKNPLVDINVVNPIKRKGYRFKGKATILSEGQGFEDICTQYRNLGIKSEIKSVVLIKVETAKEITSPLYDLGLSEQEIEAEWKKRYFSD